MKHSALITIALLLFINLYLSAQDEPQPYKSEEQRIYDEKEKEFQKSLEEFNKLMYGDTTSTYNKTSTEPAPAEEEKTGTSSFFDFEDYGLGGYEGSSAKTEKAVIIGSQTWSGSNLDVSVFRNGDAIPEAKSDEEWEKANDAGKPAWCYYNNDAANGTKYGKLYNWYAVIDPRGLAPSGWHIPTANEWNTLISALGTGGAKKMKSTAGWNGGGNGTSQADFSALPGGFRETAPDSFGDLGDNGYWWTSSVNRVMGFDLGAGLILKYDNDEPVRDSYASEGLSVRCIKN